MPAQAGIHGFLWLKGNSQAVHQRRKINKNKKFFFEKKNQKTFTPLRTVLKRPLAKN
jgi:hypothetical protein